MSGGGSATRTWTTPSAAYLIGAESGVVENAFVFHRRVLFRLLGSNDISDPQTTVEEIDGETVWRQKWGHSPGRTWDRARYGVIVSSLSGIARRITYRIGGRRLKRHFRCHAEDSLSMRQSRRIVGYVLRPGQLDEPRDEVLDLCGCLLVGLLGQPLRVDNVVGRVDPHEVTM